LVYFSHFIMLYREISGNPGFDLAAWYRLSLHRLELVVREIESSQDTGWKYWFI
jgi:hypothetical protein